MAATAVEETYSFCSHQAMIVNKSILLQGKLETSEEAMALLQVSPKMSVQYIVHVL